MDEKRPPRRPGPLPLLDEIITCVSLRGSKKDRIQAFAALPVDSKQVDSQKRIAATLSEIARRVSCVKAFAPHVVILRPIEMKRVIDNVVKSANDESIVGACRFQTSDLSMSSSSDSSTSSPGKKLTGAFDTGAQSAALLWTACSLAERTISASALVVPEQITWRQLLGVDKLPDVQSTRLGRLLVEESNGFRKLRSASWSSGADVRPRTYGNVGISRQYPPDTDPRRDLIAFRACASVSLLKRAAQVDSGVSATSEFPILEFGDGSWPLAGGSTVVDCEKVECVHRAGLVADVDGGNFGIGSCPIHVIIPVRTPECAPIVARWVARCLDTQRVSSRIVAHPVLMTGGSAAGRAAARESFDAALKQARGEDEAKGQSRRAVSVYGFTVSDDERAHVAQSSDRGDAKRFEPAHFAYARDLLRVAESVDYVLFVGTEFENAHPDWIDSIWRRREPGCGAVWYGRSYVDVGEQGRAASTRFIEDSIDFHSNLLQIQGRTRRSLTAFHMGVFRSGSVIDARLFDPRSELWSALNVLLKCVDRASNEAKNSCSSSSVSQGHKRRRKIVPQPSVHQVIAEIRMAIADIALSYVLRPSESDTGTIQSRIPRLFFVPWHVRLGLRPKHAGSYMRAESLHLTNAYSRKKNLSKKRPSTGVLWNAENEAFSTFQNLDHEWSAYLSNSVAERGESYTFRIYKPFKSSKTPVLTTVSESVPPKIHPPLPKLERTLIVYYEDAIGCVPSVVRLGKTSDAEARVCLDSAAAFGAKNQLPVIQNIFKSCGVEVCAMASTLQVAKAAKKWFEKYSPSEDGKNCSFSCEEVPGLSGSSYFGAWLAAARSSLARVTGQGTRRAFTRVLMLRSVPLWGSYNLEAYMSAHIRRFDDIGVSDAGLMPFSGGLDFSVMACRPWFLRVAVNWIDSRPDALKRAESSAVDARRVWKEMVYSLHASVALWCTPYTYGTWRHKPASEDQKSDVPSRSLVAEPYVRRRGTNIIAPHFPSIRYRWRAMFTSDVVL